jgi:O-Antigen ligase
VAGGLRGGSKVASRRHLPGLQPQPPPVLAGVGLPRASALLPLGLGIAAAAGVVAAILAASPLLALAVPFLAAGAFVAGRFPALAVTGAVFVVSIIGTITTYASSIPPQGLTDVILICLWIAVLWNLLTRGREHRVVLWPGLMFPIAYVVLTLVAVLLADRVDDGFESFRLSAWYVLAVPLLAFAPWGDETFRRIARGIVIVAVVVGAFCLFRYAGGSTESETVAARAAQPSLPFSTPLRFFGSMLSAQELAGWAAVLLPFALSMLLLWRRWWRLAAFAAVGLLAFALLASDVRTGVAAAAAGMAVSAALFLIARAFPSGVRLGTGLVTIVAVLAVGTVGYVTTVASSPETIERFEGLLDPGDDRNFQVRQERWEAAWDEILEEPLGHGLGTTGAVAQRGDVLPVGPSVLDSSYLKVGIEQGLAVMIFYAASMLILMLSLAYRAITTPQPWHASLAIGAVGTLTAMTVLFYGSLYAELPAVVVPGWVIVGLGAAAFTTYPVGNRQRRTRLHHPRSGARRPGDAAASLYRPPS